MFKKISVVIGVLFISIIFVGCSSESQPSKVGESKSDVQSTQTKSDQTQNSQAKTFKVGDVVQLNDYKVTVNSVRTSQGDDIFQPKQGNEFLYVDCTIENISNQQQTVSSVMMFRVEDKDGRSYEQTITTDGNGQLDGDVAPGRKITGEYIVEVPQNKTGLDLVFDSSLISGGQVIVNLN
ncbi:DUF4352 domain-containing protein [Clostridium sp. BJN0013]|uniref:DUF4352 domain-containing protein n=1 Tax=Clostridium sp. BJN0013 TaxID=3236840 RepID=UPI0034C5E41E